MRLLHAKTLQFADFADEENTPPYAILSHTWEDEEVTFQELYGLDVIPDEVQRKSGFKKIKACAAQAIQDDLNYVWIDTCCINKSSSSELEEAINSMFKWYERAFMCYAFLVDVSSRDTVYRQDLLQRFMRSKWFTRGWTLQELIAPKFLEFFGADWLERPLQAFLGTKVSLQEGITQRTGIHVDAFLNGSLSSYSIAQKMSWASHRKTRRLEDQAYCLMGLFGLNMPMLYGEGKKAFIRLQEEILRTTDDESIFAWSDSEQRGSRFQGLLADSPTCFTHCGSILRTSTMDHINNFPGSSLGEVINLSQSRSLSSRIFSVTNKGVKVEALLLLPKKRAMAHLREWLQVPLKGVACYLFPLHCCTSTSRRPICIFLKRSVSDENDYTFGGTQVFSRYAWETVSGLEMLQWFRDTTFASGLVIQTYGAAKDDEKLSSEAKQTNTALEFRKLPSPEDGFEIIQSWSFVSDSSLAIKEPLNFFLKLDFDSRDSILPVCALELCGADQSRFAMLIGSYRNRLWIEFKDRWSKTMRGFLHGSRSMAISNVFSPLPDRVLHQISSDKFIIARIGQGVTEGQYYIEMSVINRDEIASRQAEEDAKDVKDEAEKEEWSRQRRERRQRESQVNQDMQDLMSSLDDALGSVDTTDN